MAINEAPELASVCPMAQTPAAIGSGLGTAPVVDPLRSYPAFNGISVFENGATSSYYSRQSKLLPKLARSATADATSFEAMGTVAPTSRYSGPSRFTRALACKFVWKHKMR